MSILKAPLLTEKVSTFQKKHIFSFLTDPSATKGQIKQEVEDIYKVHVVSVHTMRYAGKQRSRYMRGRYVHGKSASYKKAMVALQDGETIDFYDHA